MSTGIKSIRGFITEPLVLAVCTLLVFSLASCCRTGSDSKFHGQTLLQELPSSHTGIQFINQLHESDTNNPLFYEYYYNGAGLAVGDINNDGLSDIFFGANMEKSRLYLNEGGLKFKDITETSDINTQGSWITGVTLVDINQDGWPDIYLSVGGNIDDDYRNLLYISNGEKDHLAFTERAKDAGLQDDGYSTQAAFFDYDRDGDLDMYLVTSAMNVPNKNSVRRPVGDGTHITTDRLYRNEGIDPVSRLPKFHNVSMEAGITWDGFGLGISISDINRDGWPDIYISNDYITNDLLYINQGDGTFKNLIRDYFRHVSYSTMGMDVADFNNDGLVDVFTLDMLPEDYFRKRIMAGNMRSYERYRAEIKAGYLEQYIRNMLQLNNGALNGEYSFSEIGQLAGVFETDWSWAPLFADFDNDTYKDLFICNGIPHDLTNMDYSALWITTMKKNPSIDFEVLRAILMKDLNTKGNVKKPNVIYRNSGGYVFDDVSKEWGMDQPSYSTSAVVSDLDNDGDLDLVLNNINDPASVYKNNLIDKTGPDSSSHYLVVHLSGSEFNRNGIGSMITLYHDDQLQFYEHFPVRGFQSMLDNKFHFGLGGNLAVDSLSIQWPDGKIQILYDIPANQTLVLSHQDASDQEYQDIAEGPDDLLFKEVSENLNIEYEHREREFVDFNIQPLIPHMYSREGPGITAGDVNGDGLDDFFIGGSTGFAGEVFIQQESGKFSSYPLPGNKNFEDMGALFFDADTDGDDDLYVVSGGTGLPPGNPFYADRLFINKDGGDFELMNGALPLDGVCGSQVTASDFDKDGDLDLFVCGRVELENYPIPPRSYLLRNDSEGSIVRFTDVTRSKGKGLENAGLISAALWSDFNKDGWPDLILAGEWMPIKFYQNVRGVFQDVTRNTSLENYTGWWNSLVAADFDKDGDMDYVAGNLGLNTRFKVSQDQPMRIVAKDFDMNGTLDPVT
ncbi:MAG: VCBS repeat-containing protein, partial [Bacteroidales bacterium]